MEKLKLFRVCVDRVWFGEDYTDRTNPTLWFNDPIEWTDWNQDLSEELDKYNNYPIVEDDSDGWEFRLCFIEVDEENFLKRWGYDMCDLSDEKQQESLNYYSNYDWTEIQYKFVDFPLP